jgi:hypothetical protein
MLGCLQGYDIRTLQKGIARVAYSGSIYPEYFEMIGAKQKDGIDAVLCCLESGKR